MIDTVNLTKIERLVQSIRRNSKEEDPAVSFEYIVGSLFPTVYWNVKNEIANSYIQGYNDGKNSKEKT